jgi:hypothetical protein
MPIDKERIWSKEAHRGILPAPGGVTIIPCLEIAQKVEYDVRNLKKLKSSRNE